MFAYREGDKRRPDLATGKALQAMIRIVSEYKGAVLWKMQAGMGDTVFTPLYDVLRSRGVRVQVLPPGDPARGLGRRRRRFRRSRFSRRCG